MSVPERPERMRRNGRPEDQEFAPTEKLFRRYTREHYINGQFSNVGFAFTSPQSLNRQKYSEPVDVLFSETGEFASWGVLSFKAGDLPTSFPADNPRFTFFAKHVPREDNYAHSEVWCDSLPATGKYVMPNKQVKKLFRASLSQRIVIEIAATI
jgi:hypothetical protein